MRTWKNLSLSLVLVGSLAGAAGAQTQTADQTQPQAGVSTASPVTVLTAFCAANPAMSVSTGAAAGERGGRKRIDA